MKETIEDNMERMMPSTLILQTNAHIIGGRPTPPIAVEAVSVRVGVIVTSHHA